MYIAVDPYLTNGSWIRCDPSRVKMDEFLLSHESSTRGQCGDAVLGVCSEIDGS